MVSMSISANKLFNFKVELPELQPGGNAPVNTPSSQKPDKPGTHKQPGGNAPESTPSWKPDKPNEGFIG